MTSPAIIALYAGTAILGLNAVCILILSVVYAAHMRDPVARTWRLHAKTARLGQYAKPAGRVVPLSHAGGA